jgi:hypothetical protein
VTGIVLDAFALLAWLSGETGASPGRSIIACCGWVGQPRRRTSGAISAGDSCPSG